MSDQYTPTHSETLVFIGAGATAKLGMPSSNDQTTIFRDLCKKEASKEALLSKFFSEPDLQKVVAFLKFLDSDNFYEVSDDDLKSAKVVYGEQTDGLLKRRILELRTEYDWNAAKKIIKICPHDETDDNLIRDVYSIIDGKLLSHQSLKVSIEKSEEILSESRLQGARNFLTLFINMLFASAWNKIADGEKSEEFNQYKKFINSFDRLMQKEARDFYRRYSVESRDFYLFTTSFVSFNFEMVFPWLFMNSHYELNHQKSYMKDKPLKLWLDFGCEHRGRKTNLDGEIISTLEFTEAVASRENEDEHIGSELNRCGKFYFAHGSSNWRECPVCGRMTFYFGYSRNKWSYKSKELTSPFPIPLFGMDKINSLTAKEKEWRKQLRFDSLQCMHCGAETVASDAPMIMQTMYKSTPTSFLEEIQRNVKVSIEKARHIVLLGYRLPVDDTIWQHAFAEGVRSRQEGNEAFCSVVVGYMGEKRWLYGEELMHFVDAHRKADDSAAWGADAIENAIAIFGKEKVRAWTGGIPQVFGECTEMDVKELFYPDFVEWKNTRLEI